MGFNFEDMKTRLVCPECHSELIRDGDTLVCTNPEVRLRYDIVDEIPRMLVDEAKRLSVEDWAEVMRRSGRDPDTGAAVESDDS